MGAPAGNNLNEIAFTGISARVHSHRVSIDYALSSLTSNCDTDADTVTGRPGSRTALAAAVVATGLVQHAGRFRPSGASKRTVEVIAGEIWLIKDPTAETASDGVKVSLGVLFGTTANICGTQLGNSYYLGTDEIGVSGQRINWGTPFTDADGCYTLESIGAYPQGAKPTATVNTSLSWTVFSGITPTVSGCVVQTNGNTGWTTMPSTWRGFSATNNGNDHPATGAYAQYKLAANVDASACDWLVIAVSPFCWGNEQDGELRIDLSKDSAGSPVSPQTVGVIHDTPVARDCPSYVFLDLRNMDPTVRSAVRYITFTLDKPVGGKFMTYGYIFLPAANLLATDTYYVDFYNASTGQFSALTDGLEVSPGVAAIATFPDAYMQYHGGPVTGANDNPYNAATLHDRCFNTTANGGNSVPYPKQTDIGATVSIAGTTSHFGSTALTVRLWKLTDNNGIRLANSSTAAVAQDTLYTITDPGGLLIETNQLYKAGGTLPPCNALTSYAQRLLVLGTNNTSSTVKATGNRVFVSSYIPTSDRSNPFPQFPSIALEDADGWAFDIAPSPKEFGLVANGNGDAVYICTNEATYAMSDLTPNSLPWLVLRRGAVSRNGGGFFEDRFQWLAWDGIYQAIGKSAKELSFDVRTYYKSTFLPDYLSCIGYNQRERALYAFSGTKYLKYAYELDRWLPGTVSANVVRVLSWNEQGVASAPPPQMWIFTDTWIIGRWQSGVYRDLQVGTDTATGAAIPAWVYSTGFLVLPKPGLTKGIMVDADGGIVVTVSKTVEADGDFEARTFLQAAPFPHQDEQWHECPSDLRSYKWRFQFNAANPVTLRRAAYALEPVDAVGG